jgi:hypothetical protein
MTWVLDVPGGEGTDARRRTLRNHVRRRACRVNRSSSTDVLNIGWTIFGLNVGWTVFRLSVRWTIFGRGAGMVVGWG